MIERKAGKVSLRQLSELANKATEKAVQKAVLTVSVNDVVPKDQIRKRFRDIEGLAATIKTEGQQTPIVVYPKGEDGKYVIQKGERRWRACLAAKIPTIDIIVNTRSVTDIEEVAGELIENIQRDDLTPIEIASALHRLSEAGWTNRAIAGRIGKNEIYVSTHLSLTKLPDCVRELCEKEVTVDTETLNNLRQLYGLTPRVCLETCKQALYTGISRVYSRELLNNAKAQKEKRKSAPTAPEKGKVEPAAGGDVGVDKESGDREKDRSTDKAATLSQKSSNTVPSSGAQEEQSSPKEPDPDIEWWETSETQIRVKISSPNGRTVIGHLIPNRVTINPEFVWVDILQPRGSVQQMVHVSNLQLEAVTGLRPSQGQ